jgi:hypothetical protein
VFVHLGVIGRSRGSPTPVRSDGLRKLPERRWRPSCATQGTSLVLFRTKRPAGPSDMSVRGSASQCLAR